MKVVVWDIETAPLTARTWSLYPNSINHDDIINDTYVICVAFKELGLNPVYAVNTLHDNNDDPCNDYHVVRIVANYLRDADVLIAHNGDNFDLKRFNARVIFHGLEPLPPIATIDTLKEVKKVARFTSHRLDYLAKHLGFEGKYQTPKGLWKRSCEGDEDAIKEMTTYCKEDVRQLEKIYLKLRKYFKGHVNLADVGTTNCPRCNSGIYSVAKQRLTASGIRRTQYQCSSCGGYFTERKSLKNKPDSKI